MEGTGQNDTEAKENATPKFGRRQNRRVSSADDSVGPAAQIDATNDTGNEASPAEKWVDDIVADVDAIPEMTDAKDSFNMNLLSTTPAFKTGDSIQSLQELDGEIGLQLSANAEGIDLSLLVRTMYPRELLEEPETAWNMDLLMSEIASDAQIKKESRST